MAEEKKETKKEFLARVQSNVRMTLSEEKLEEIWDVEQKRIKDKNSKQTFLLNKQED